MAFLVTFFAALFLLIPNALLADAVPSLSFYNWTVNASPNLATHHPPIEAIRKFMAQLITQLVFDNEPTSESEVCSFRFADLRLANNLTLLVSLYDGGHGGCGSVYIVDRTASGFQLHYGEGNTYGTDDVNDVVRDLNHDGKLELVFDDEFTAYEGGNHCFATWPVIYAWDGSNYANLSAQSRFRPFYEQQIKTLQQGARDDCDEATIAKIQRFLGAPPNTGLADAIVWANSSNRFQREFAVDVLSDIGTPEAKKYLRKLTKDRDVARQAKIAFAYRHFGQPPPPEPKFLDSAAAADQAAADNQDHLAELAEPWHLIIPPVKGGKLDLSARDSDWTVMRGFDSKEQCQFGFELIRQEIRRDPPDYPNHSAMPHGKCVPAPAH